MDGPALRIQCEFEFDGILRRVLCLSGKIVRQREFTEQTWLKRPSAVSKAGIDNQVRQSPSGL